MVLGGESAKAGEFKGCSRDNYPSAVQFAEDVRRTLVDQTGRGQVLVMSESDARATYGDRLTIASLGAIEKGMGSDGLTEVRIIHDGTNGIDLNRYTCVRDGGLSPVASDLKAVMRMQAASGQPHIGAAIDAKEAHRLVAIRPEDWPLVACQVYPGCDVYLNKVGTYGVASAAYWWGRVAAGGPSHSSHHSRQRVAALGAALCRRLGPHSCGSGIPTFRPCIRLTSCGLRSSFELEEEQRWLQVFMGWIREMFEILDAWDLGVTCCMVVRLVQRGVCGW